MTSLLKDVSLADISFEDVQKEGSLYSVKFKKRIKLETPAVTCVEALTNGKGELLPYLYIQPDDALHDFLHDFDKFVVSEAQNHRDSWFRDKPSRREVEDSFKSYWKAGEPEAFRIKLLDDVEVYDSNRQPMRPSELQAGEKVKLIMEVSRISIGKSSYGTIWKCPQVMRQRQQQCLFADDGDMGVADDDDDEFP